MKSTFLTTVMMFFVLASTAVYAATLKWAGMRNPCKISAGDGITDKQLGIKIGKFITLDNKEEWERVILNVKNRFPDAKPWVTWAVGELKDATTLPDNVQEEYLNYMDKLGVEVFLEIWPRKNDDVLKAIDTWLDKLKHHKSVAGFGVDLEYYKKVDDATAKVWDEKIKFHNPKYRLFFKHWEQSFMPPTYRGKGDMIFINTSSEASIDVLNEEFAKWANHFAPSACAFMIGYPADEDGMDGKNTDGWWKLQDPIKDWGNSLIAKIKSPDQEIGIIWVCAKSGKTYNGNWDLTKDGVIPLKGK